VDKKLQLKLTARLAHLEKIKDEPVMEDFDAGLRTARYEEYVFIKEVLKEYGESNEGQGNTCSRLYSPSDTVS
jgi:hypothetical protein